MFLASIFRNDVFPRCAARQLPGQPSVTQRMIQKKKRKESEREREREKEYKEKEIEQREKIIAARVLGVRGT